MDGPTSEFTGLAFATFAARTALMGYYAEASKDQGQL